MKKGTAKIWLAGVFILFAFCLSSSVGLCQQKPIELTYSTHMPAANGSTKLAIEWGKEIEKRTNGRVKVTMHVGATLLAADKAYNGVIQGIADVAWVVLGVTKGRFPLTEVLELPLGYKSGAQATKVINEYYKKFKPKEFDNTQVMYLFGQSPVGIHAKKTIRKLDDFKGLKIRTTGAHTQVALALGGTPVGMPVNETYDALSRGVVDATIGGFDALRDFKWAEVVKCSVESTGFGFSSAFGVFMNKNKWNALPPDIQKIIESINEEWSQREGKVWDASEEAGKEFSRARGNEVTSLPPEEAKKAAAALQPQVNDYLQRTKKLGLPADEVLNFFTAGLK